MPEGDTLLRTAAALRERILGQVCQAVSPASFGRLVGKRVTGVDAYGKHLFIRFESGLSLHSHMRMTGAWYVYRPGERWTKPERDARLVLSFEDWVAVLFLAPVIEIVADDERVRHLGPDILAEPFDLEEVIARARGSDSPTVGELLLDQRVCAGIGNIYRCESLFALGLNPWLAPSRVDDATLARLYRTARRLMRESAYDTVPRRRPAVHGRAGRACRRCSQLVLVKPQGTQARLAYWCPRCQEMP